MLLLENYQKKSSVCFKEQSVNGFVYFSFNKGNRTDTDKIISAELIDEKRIKIKYECSRIFNVYTAILVYDLTTESLNVTQVKMENSEKVCKSSSEVGVEYQQ